MFAQTKWKYSDEKNEYASPEEGRRALYIQNAEYDETEVDNPIYNLTLVDIENGARIPQRYWLNTSDRAGNTIRSRATVGTLDSLGKALAGVSIGIPCPEDIIGGVVIGEVQLQKKEAVDKDGNAVVRSYARVYKFFPAPEDVVLDNSKIDQYWEGSEDTQVVLNTDEVALPSDDMDVSEEN